MCMYIEFLLHPSKLSCDFLKQMKINKVIIGTVTCEGKSAIHLFLYINIFMIYTVLLLMLLGCALVVTRRFQCRRMEESARGLQRWCRLSYFLLLERAYGAYPNAKVRNYPFKRIHLFNYFWTGQQTGLFKKHLKNNFTLLTFNKYAEHQVLLTVRDPVKWYQSVKNSIFR